MPYDGNLVVIDHGLGIKTWYGHLGSIDVKEGDGVIKGQQIGTGGPTGMPLGSPGLNLFFAVSVKNIFINPVTFIENGIPGLDSVSTGGFSDPGGNIEAMDESGMPEAAAEDIIGEE